MCSPSWDLTPLTDTSSFPLPVSERRGNFDYEYLNDETFIKNRKISYLVPTPSREEGGGEEATVIPLFFAEFRQMRKIDFVELNSVHADIFFEHSFFIFN